MPAFGRTPWQIAKYHALMHQNRRTCEICGFSAATDAHHAIVKRDKRFKVVDNICNLQMVCHECHMEGKADAEENKERAVRLSIRYNGIEAVLAWLNECRDAGKLVGEQILLVIWVNGFCKCGNVLDDEHTEVCRDCR